MDSTVIRRGALAGMAGGVVMAMWSMLALAASGHGFFTPVNLIAHTIWNGAPLGGGFALGALALGMVVHLATSMMIGVGIAVVVQRLGADRARGAALGMAAGLGVWLVNQYVVWPALDSVAAGRFTPWVFALGHVMFGVVAGAAAVAWSSAGNEPLRTGLVRPHPRVSH